MSEEIGSETTREKTRLDRQRLVEAKERPQRGGQDEVNHGGRHIASDPVSVAGAPKNIGEVIELDERGSENQQCRPSRAVPFPDPKVKDHARGAHEEERKLNASQPSRARVHTETHRCEPMQHTHHQ